MPAAAQATRPEPPPARAVETRAWREAFRLFPAPRPGTSESALTAFRRREYRESLLDLYRTGGVPAVLPATPLAVPS